MINQDELSEKEGQLYQAGLAILDSVFRLAGKDKIEFELQSKRSSWTDLRQRYNQHMIAWQLISRMDIALDDDFNMIGWCIHKRKELSGSELLPKTIMEVIASSAPYLSANHQLAEPTSIELGDNKQFSQVMVSGGIRDYVLSVNSEDLSIIGVMPTTIGKVQQVPIDDQFATLAHDALWAHVKDLVEKTGNKDTEAMDKAFRLSLRQGIIDEHKTRLYSFNAQQFFSECDVDLNENDCSMLGWYVEGFKSGADKSTLNDKNALDIAKQVLHPDDNKEGPTTEQMQLGDDHIVRVVWWDQIGDIIVEGNQTTVTLNAKTGQIFSMDRKRRVIDPTLLQAKQISREEAIAITNRQRSSLSIPSSIPAKLMEQKVIEVCDKPNEPGIVRDCLVWCVGFADLKASSFTQVAVDTASGEVVRVTGW